MYRTQTAAGPTFSLQCTALMGTNKIGNLQVDADGYYEVVLGALDCFNSGGSYYDYHFSKTKFEESGILMKRILNGQLRGELGHPKRQPGQSLRDYNERVLHIYEDRTCMTIRKIWLDPSPHKDPRTGRPIVLIMGKIKPSGELGHVLKDQLNNPHENVCFSLRSFTVDKIINGVNTKFLDNIITWDYVNEPGISHATKYNTPSLEDELISPITRDMLVSIGAERHGHGLEAASVNQMIASMIASIDAQVLPKTGTNIARW